MKIKYIIILFFCYLIGDCQGAAEQSKKLSPEEYALFEAIFNHDIPRIKQIIKSGVNVNVINLEKQEIQQGSSTSYIHPNYTPLHFAIFYRAKPSIIKLLLNSGAKVNALDTIGQNELNAFLSFLGSRKSEGEILETVEMLLAYGANPKISDWRGESAKDKAEKEYQIYLAKANSQYSDEREYARKKIDLWSKIITLLKEQKPRVEKAGEELKLLGFPPEVAAIAQSYLAIGDWEKNIKQKTQGPPGGPAMDLTED